ncbi:MAG: peptidase M61 [Reichenbachiella sp.]|uniref:M61 family metallopeptidase n=1 Tax=Reichenbachiella sp. TaxID=2184521 RepID=UPI0032637663
MKTLSIFLMAMMLYLSGHSRPEDQYVYTLDLTVVKDDQVQVILIPPKIKESETTFYMPKIIPGTYSVADYGRFVQDFKAFDKKGNELIVEKTSVNSWKISKSNKMTKVTYWVKDSYDNDVEGPAIFEPAGSNIEEGKNFVINSAGFFGYFENMTRTPFKFNIIRDTKMYGSTGLIAISTGQPMDTGLGLGEVKPTATDAKVDTYLTESYDHLIDNPLMYCEPDTSVINVAGAEVLISTYSPGQVVKSAEVKGAIEQILMAQKEYLGGKLPVDKYAFICYFTERPVTSIGALEHSYSSVYSMRNQPMQTMQGLFNRFAAHEFFHIVTPLNIHSQEIHQFDFNEPKMSKHLWLYEGITEFFAGNVQVKYGIISQEAYLRTLQNKMITASTSYNDTLAFTDLSKYTLGQYQDQYGNVYEKGALIGMCLDLQLRSLSDGKYGVQNMMADLAKKFGKDSAFNDDELFDLIAEMTYPEIRSFFSTYVEGNTPLPYDKMLALAGVDYVPSEIRMEISMGLPQGTYGYNPETSRIYITNTDGLNDFGKSLGLKNGDELVGINGKEIPLRGIGAFLGEVRGGMKVGDEFTYTVMRASEDGTKSEVDLSSEIVEVEVEYQHVLSLNEDPTEAQLAVRNGWLTKGE